MPARCIPLIAIATALTSLVPSVPGAETPLPQSSVVSVKHKPANDRAFGIGDIIAVEIPGLSEWRSRTPTDQRALSLYVDGVPFSNAELTRAEDDVAEFRLKRDASDTDNLEAWNRLLSRPMSFSREVTVSVGPNGRPPFASADADPKTEGIQKPKLALTILWMPGFWIYLVALAGLCFGIWKLGNESSLLRDGGEGGSSKDGTFSLAKSQMAFWFVVVLAAYCFLWLVTGSADTLSTSALGLLGISAGTGFISTLIDKSKQAGAKEEITTAEMRQAELQRDIQAVGGVPNTVQLQHLAASGQAIAAAGDQLRKQPSEGFFKDILTDANGITLHRLQIAVWTLVLGIYFLVCVYQQLAMPEISGTLLGLMGLSSATYLGLKGPEKQQ